jgi:hypothetical protein
MSTSGYRPPTAAANEAIEAGTAIAVSMEDREHVFISLVIGRPLRRVTDFWL